MAHMALTTTDAARILQITERRVRQLALARGVGQKVGRDWLFTAAEVDQMRERKVGRPRNPQKQRV